jgi:molybdenum cofactor cytidylyltransferase
MFQLARELKPPVIITATSHLGVWQIPQADRHIVAGVPDDFRFLDFRGVTLITGPMIEDQKTEPIDSVALLQLHEVAKEKDIPLLIEADGSRQKPLKAPAAHEPAIPEFVDTVIVVAGLSALGKPLSSDDVHRPEIFSLLSGLQLGEQISNDSILRVITHTEGGCKNIPTLARRLALLNQVDSTQLQAQAHGMAKPLLSTFDAVVIASLKAEAVYAVHEPVAGIVLAAGESKRYGSPKQLLDFHGNPFVRVVATKALEAGLSPVIVVTGAHSGQIEDALKNLPITISRNENWMSGQSSSIQAGIQSLPKNIGSAVFLLTDQPQVTTTVIRALIESHTSELHPVVAPLVQMNRRANPVLFDRVTFPDLLTLKGDIGGRAIFSNYHVEYLPWHDDKLLLDVDTPQDYQRLIEAVSS